MSINAGLLANILMCNVLLTTGLMLFWRYSRGRKLRGSYVLNGLLNLFFGPLGWIYTAYGVGPERSQG
ncbi:hypothetical protein [Gallaecimonas sp. GXIMD4217]|uniref:hypothetical protein n=1 Tax=Gallaecimonas sp. GXIMD4217 TaxID=3131927 RepID=UPI00311ABFDF